jgi:hypothetical protein
MTYGLLKFLGVLIIIMLLFEGIILAIAYFNADEVSCNLLWCTFKTTIKESRQTCYQNGELINCSEVEDGFRTGIPING